MTRLTICDLIFNLLAIYFILYFRLKYPSIIPLANSISYFLFCLYISLRKLIKKLFIKISNSSICNKN